MFDLETIWPMVRTLARRWPHLFYQLHNEMAVELAAIGQLDAARRAVAVAVAAPIAAAYPEWQQTDAELRELERAAVVAAVPIRKPRPRNVRTLTSEQWPVVSGQWSVVSSQRSDISREPVRRASLNV